MDKLNSFEKDALRDPDVQSGYDNYDIIKQGQEALARVNTHINNLYWNARMEVKSDFTKGRAFLRTLFVPEKYGIEATEEVVDPDAPITFPKTFAEFEVQKQAR